jgi:hypothetical protein
MKSETNKRTVSSAPACWQREAPCACLRIETSAREMHLLPYAHLIAASLISVEDSETLRLTFSAHDVEIEGRNLRALLLAIQEFAVKWVRVIPQRYRVLELLEDGYVSSVTIREAGTIPS